MEKEKQLARVTEELHQLQTDADTFEQDVNNIMNEQQKLELQDKYDKCAPAP